MTAPFHAQHRIHRRLLAEEVERAVRLGALGLWLGGSVARGTARPSSDLDLWLFWPRPQPFEAEERSGILVERHGRTFAQVWTEVEAGGGGLYTWFGGRALHDPQGELAQVAARAACLLAAYRVPPRERRALRHWLLTTLNKLGGADPDHALFLVHTTTWKVAEALCAVNSRPPPSGTQMWEVLPGLPRQPPGPWREALVAGEAEVRLSTFRQVTRWLLEALADEPG